MPMQYEMRTSMVMNAAAPMPAPVGPPMSTKGKAGGVLGGAVRAIGDLLGGRASAPAPKTEEHSSDRYEGEGEDESARAPSGVRFRRFAAPLEIAGRMHVLADGTLVVEIDVPASGLEWNVLAEVELEIDDGRRIVVSLDPSRTTLAGMHTAGTRLRLALSDAARHGTVSAIHLGGPAPLTFRV